MGGGRLQEVVTLGGSTVINTLMESWGSWGARLTVNPLLVLFDDLLILFYLT